MKVIRSCLVYVNDVTVRHEGTVRGAEITKNTPQGYGEDLVVLKAFMIEKEEFN